jgi:integrase/recombinase XerC
MKSLSEFTKATASKQLRDLDASRTAKWLTSLKAGGLSARSVNKRLQAVRQFARWLTMERRVAYDPFLSLKLLNERVDRRHVRRALSPQELASLLAAAERRPLEEAWKARVLKGVTPKETLRLTALGRARALAYAVAAGTGLRKGELSRLRWGDLDLERRIVSIPAASAKSKVDQSVPLRSDLAEALLAYRPEGAVAGDVVFPSRVYPTLRTFKRDAVAAGLGTMERPKGLATGREKYDLVDESGRALDFHCLRVTFVSSLVAAGVHPRVAQALARHAKVETTMAIYSDVHALDLRGALESSVPQGASHRQAERPIVASSGSTGPKDESLSAG